MMMHRPTRMFTLVLLAAIVAAACGGPAPTPAPTPSDTPRPAMTPPTFETLPPASATPTTPSASGSTPPSSSSNRVPWAYLHEFASPTKTNFSKYVLYVGFTGAPATAAIVLGSTATYQVSGELVMVTSEKRTVVYRIADGEVVRNIGYPVDPVLDGRGDRWVFYKVAPTFGEGGVEIGGVEFRRINLTTGDDTMLLAFGRPFGEPWADSDHANSYVPDLDVAGTIHILVCGNGIDGSECSFYIAKSTESDAEKQVAVSGNVHPMCRLIGANAQFAFTSEMALKSDSKTSCRAIDTAQSVGIRLTDLASGDSKPILVVDKKLVVVPYPQVVATTEGARLVYTFIVKGSKNVRVMATYNPLLGSSTTSPISLGKGLSRELERYLVLLPVDAGPLAGKVLLAPAYVVGLKRALPLDWSTDAPVPMLVDVLTNVGQETKVWDVPSDWLFRDQLK